MNFQRTFLFGKPSERAGERYFFQRKPLPTQVHAPLLLSQQQPRDSAQFSPFCTGDKAPSDNGRKQTTAFAASLHKEKCSSRALLNEMPANAFSITRISTSFTDRNQNFRHAMTDFPSSCGFRHPGGDFDTKNEIPLERSRI